MTGTVGIVVMDEVSVFDSVVFIVVVATVVFLSGPGVVISGQGVEAGVRRSVSQATLRSSKTLSCLEIDQTF